MTKKNIIFLLFISALLNQCIGFNPHSPADQETALDLRKADTNIVLPPSWAFGMIYGSYTNQEQSIELVNQIMEHDYPIDAFWIDSWIWDYQNQGRGPEKYIDFVADTVSYPDLGFLWSYFEQHNIKAGMWIWDCILKTGNEAAYKEFREKGLFANEYIRTDSWHNGSRTTIMGDGANQVKGTWCGDIDFTNSEAVALVREKMKHFFDQGLDFLKLDKSNSLPFCKAMYEMTRDLGQETGGRGFIFSHSGKETSDTYKNYPAKWTNDTRSDWTVESPTKDFSPWLPGVAFKENIAMYTDTSRIFHEIPFMANDMGGFALGLDRKVDEELYIRWLEFACFLPVTTPFSQPENTTGNIAFKVSQRADKLFREYAHRKMRLFPYIYSYAHLSRLLGIPAVRPVPGHLYEYYLGGEILVAPVYEQGNTSREVFLPQGQNWVDYWTGEEYPGDTAIRVQAPIDRIPLFIVKGSIIPMRQYASSIQRGTNDTLEVHIYPGEERLFRLIEDDGISNDYLSGGFALTSIRQKLMNGELEVAVEPVWGTYQNMKNERVWKFIIHCPPETVLSNPRLNGKKIESIRDGSILNVSAFHWNKNKAFSLKIKFS